MAKCDVCGKMSLVPEKFGDVLICKMCFMKLNGPFWKYRQYDRRNDVEKQRGKVIDLARKQNFPENAIREINRYFDEQVKGMTSCDVCGVSVQTLNPVGHANLCKKCFSKIGKAEWKEDDYSDNKEVEKNRKKILKIAEKQNFPKNVIKGINEHFDSKIQVGLIDTVYGESQKLKVFETHCILETYGNFDEDEISKRYAKLLRKSRQGVGLISNGAAQALVRGVFGGGVVKAGMSLATSAVVNAAANAIAPDKVSFRAKKGKFTMNYDYYDIVEFQKVLSIGYEDELGYMRFRSSQQPMDEANAVMFFFDNNYSAEEMYNYICERIELAKKKKIENASKQQQSQYISVADEILKFKKLLDMGAITEEEFLEKKKELLNS